MSKALKSSMASWAQDEDSSDEEVLLHDEEDEDVEEEEEEEEEEVEIHDLNISLKTSTEVKPIAKPINTANLSKKERKELQKKEIDELDSILSEFGAPVTSSIPVDSSDIEEKNNNHIVVNDAPSVPPSDRKKKKKKSSSKSPNNENVDKEPPVEDTPSIVTDVTAVLKNKLKKNSKKSNNVSIAVQEALKATAATSDSKSKKKEMLKAKKQSYNEYSI